MTKTALNMALWCAGGPGDAPHPSPAGARRGVDALGSGEALDAGGDGHADPHGASPWSVAEAEHHALLHRLAVAARSGDIPARDELLERLGPLAQGNAYRAALYGRRLGLTPPPRVEDLRQEAYTILLALIDRFDPEKGAPLPFFTLRLRARLRRLVQGQARRRPRGRRLAWESRAAQELAESLEARLYNEAVGWMASGVAGALHAAIAQLSVRQKRLLYLSYWRQLTDEEIGATLHVSTTAVYQMRYRALERLRAHLTAAGFGPPSKPPRDRR
ncbi:MAG: sigma-70 family RNA polymerase sigma factor [Chloroflexi bacterium]|nr:sigma-70 family RNA polymerase sigma factor [Chloroflexota bacterium]